MIRDSDTSSLLPDHTSKKSTLVRTANCACANCPNTIHTVFATIALRFRPNTVCDVFAVGY